jgi:hypothetical protein
MKINTLKILSISSWCVISALWTETQCSEEKEVPGLLKPSTMTQSENYGTVFTPITDKEVVRTYEADPSIPPITEHSDGSYMVPSGTNIAIHGTTGQKSLSDVGSGKDYPLTEVKK